MVPIADIVTEAKFIAQANGLATNELKAVDVGQLNPAGAGTFTADVTPCNAVPVAAKRCVNLFFGKIHGLGMEFDTMAPPAKSVAALTRAGSADGGEGAGFVPCALHAEEATNTPLAYARFLVQNRPHVTILAYPFRSPAFLNFDVAILFAKAQHLLALDRKVEQGGLNG